MKIHYLFELLRCLKRVKFCLFRFRWTTVRVPPSFICLLVENAILNTLGRRLDNSSVEWRNTSNLPISHPNFSFILEHHKLSKHALSPLNFKILRNSSNSDIRLLESIYIYKLKSKLNNNTPCELNIV